MAVTIREGREEARKKNGEGLILWRRSAWQERERDEDEEDEDEDEDEEKRRGMGDSIKEWGCGRWV